MKEEELVDRVDEVLPPMGPTDRVDDVVEDTIVNVDVEEEELVLPPIGPSEDEAEVVVDTVIEPVDVEDVVQLLEKGLPVELELEVEAVIGFQSAHSLPRP